eukprot:CAMPEP_0167761584 /NCGR_PEP_ID=MMETSP0110_2-20121227/12257_1 /TAXON_ID=629695 /ORGANISM="Gymnochlora sp., Strain CCMP2014" /LENGTH=208 /DNA_ID=CAMNT_0007648291 /DNA_START=25 /DNA_END=651 /DNA_ORIENTATION=-
MARCAIGMAAMAFAIILTHSYQINTLRMIQPRRTAFHARPRIAPGIVSHRPVTSIKARMDKIINACPKRKGEKNVVFGFVDRNYLDEILARIEEGSPNHLVLDIREPAEQEEAGVLPYAVCVPASELETALDLSAKDWQIRYGFPKPKPDDEIVVYGENHPDSEYDPTHEQRTINVCTMLAKEYGFKLVQRYSQKFFDYFNDPFLSYF